MSGKEARFLVSVNSEVGDGQNTKLGEAGWLAFQLQYTIDFCGGRVQIALAISKQRQERSSCVFQHPGGCPGHEAALRTNTSLPEIGSQLFTYTNNTIKGL